jgi:two-component system, chemotaxis family, protein-glutamate methylesterase/glutaminase
MSIPQAVVIGGSAGSFDVLRRIVSSLPTSLACPVIIVIHLPAHSIGLADLFGNVTPLRVKQAEDKEPIEPGTIYIAPPSYHLLIESHRAFALSADAPVHFSRPAIDVLFEAARDVYGPNLIGILLSGASDDGAAGLHEIHQAGGITIVQAPSSADSTLMPASALALFEPTHIWTPDEIAAGLSRLLTASVDRAGRSTH